MQDARVDQSVILTVEVVQRHFRPIRIVVPYAIPKSEAASIFRGDLGRSHSATASLVWQSTSSRSIAMTGLPSGTNSSRTVPGRAAVLGVAWPDAVKCSRGSSGRAEIAAMVSSCISGVARRGSEGHKMMWREQKISVAHWSQTGRGTSRARILLCGSIVDGKRIKL